MPRVEFKKTLINGLRRKHKYKRTKKKEAQYEKLRGKIQNMLYIHERPAEVADRTVPGYWESDLIIGKYKRSAIATLVEKTIRVREALTKAVSDIPLHLRKSLKNDLAKEMYQLKEFTKASNMTVYFADLASP